jgi:hypothetical protein
MLALYWLNAPLSTQTAANTNNMPQSNMRIPQGSGALIALSLRFRFGFGSGGISFETCSWKHVPGTLWVQPCLVLHV